MKLINDKLEKIIRRVSFLAGIQTAAEVNTGWTDAIKIKNFKIAVLKLSLDRKKYVK